MGNAVRPAAEIAIGRVRAVALSDATEVVALGDVFPRVPSESWQPYRSAYPSLFSSPTDWRLDHACYLLRSAGRIILVDTGIGAENSPLCAFYRMEGGRLLGELRSLGVRPDEVDTVVLTHLHPDHIGWNTVEHNGKRGPTFTRARYIVHAADWETFHNQPESLSSLFPYAFLEELLAPLEADGRLELISEEATLTNEIRLIHSPGHTPGSISVVIASEDANGIIWGDVTAHPAQMAEPDWDFLFDMDIETARRTRRQLLESVVSAQSSVACAHVSGFGRIERFEGRPYWRSISQ